jgi:hypothetical protein
MHIRRITAALSAACLVGVGLIASATGASATGDNDDSTPYVLAAWQMPDDGSGWPQHLVEFEYTAVVSLDLLDDELASKPGCHQYQVDLYRDSAITDSLLAGRVLYGVNTPPEDLVTWKYFWDTECDIPVTVQFDVPTTAPTCEAGAMFDAVFPIVREGYTLTVDRPYDGPGVYTITATAAEGYVFSGPGDPTVRTTTVTLAGALTGPCHVGGLTIGYYKNHPVSEATWDAASAAYPAIFSGLDTWAKALAVLKTANNKGDGTSMLRAQAIAFALNIETIDGFGEKYVTGTTTAAEYLAWINSAWGTTALDTKAERTAVKNILDAANQHA